MLTEAFLSAVTEAVFSHLMQESGLTDRVRAALGVDPQRRALQTALAQAYASFARQHPDWAASLFDETFLKGPAAPILATLLTRRGAPAPEDLARRWCDHLGRAPAPHRLAAATRAAADFLTAFEAELANQPVLQALWDSRALERISSDVAAIRRLLEEQFQAALNAARQVTIAGYVRDSLIIIGDDNVVIQNLIAPVRRLPTDYATRIDNFLHTYLGMPQRPVPFGGRDAALQRLDAWLADPTTPYLLLTVPAGRGKSALLARWLARLRPDPPVVFVPISVRFGTNLASVAFTSLAAQLARTFGEEAPADANTPTRCGAASAAVPDAPAAARPPARRARRGGRSGELGRRRRALPARPAAGVEGDRQRPPDRRAFAGARLALGAGMGTAGRGLPRARPARPRRGARRAGKDGRAARSTGAPALHH